MVRIAGGSEVLLQSNVSDQLEGTKQPNVLIQLRRDMAGAGITTPAEG